MEKWKIIATDFDGTLCKNKYPEIGEPYEQTIKHLKEAQKRGARLILWTCRAGERLEAAIAWSREQGLEFEAVNENLPDIIEAFGGDTRKIYADVYMDDRNGYLTEEALKGLPVTPQAVQARPFGRRHYCPVCTACVVDEEDRSQIWPNFCPNCGQRFDWHKAK